jgi:hypothetical protein
MPDLPARPDLEQIRHQAKDLLPAARAGDDTFCGRIAAVSSLLTLSAAQLAVAREHGFANWPPARRVRPTRTFTSGWPVAATPSSWSRAMPAAHTGPST